MWRPFSILLAPLATAIALAACEDAPPTADASCVLTAPDVEPSNPGVPVRGVFDVALPTTTGADNMIAALRGTTTDISAVTVSASYILTSTGAIQQQSLHSAEDPLQFRAVGGWSTPDGVVGAFVQRPQPEGGLADFFCTLSPGGEMSAKQCARWIGRDPLVIADQDRFRLYILDVDSVLTEPTGLTETVVTTAGSILTQTEIAPAVDFTGYGNDGDLLTIAGASQDITAITTGLTSDLFPYCPVAWAHTIENGAHLRTVLVPSNRELVRSSHWAHAHDATGRAAFLFATACIENRCEDDNIPNPDEVSHLRIYDPTTGWSEHLARGTDWSPEVMFFDGDTIVTLHMEGGFEEARLLMTRYVDGAPRDVAVNIPISIGGGTNLANVFVGAALAPNDYVVGYGTNSAGIYTMRIARFQVE
jgi:hypothetical protein